jgi:gluconate kinase
LEVPGPEERALSVNIDQPMADVVASLVAQLEELP